MSDTISSRLNYSIKLSNRAVTPPPSMWLLARTPFPISHQNGVFLRLCCHFCILYLFGMSLDFSSYDCKKIIDSKATVRKTATKFGVSKSTVHKDLTERLPQIDHHLADEVRDILDINKSERHIRGGMATRQKYLLLHRVN